MKAMIPERVHPASKTVQVKKNTVVFILALSSVAALFLVFVTPQKSEAANNSKITVNHPAVTFSESGGQQVIQLQLSQPIICPSVTTTTQGLEPAETDPEEPTLPATIDPDDPGICQVVLHLTNSDSTRVSMSTQVVRWRSNEWFEPRTLTLSGIHDNVDNPDGVVTISGDSTGTTAPYYSGESISVAVTLTDPDDVATTTTTTTTTAAPSTTGDSETTSTTAPPEPTISLSSATAKPGDTTTVRGRGFKPNSDVTVSLHSTPIFLGTAHTNSAGAFTATFSLPNNIAVGSHTIIATGVNQQDDPISAEQPLSVALLPATGSETKTLIFFAFAIIVSGATIVSRRNKGRGLSSRSL